MLFPLLVHGNQHQSSGSIGESGKLKNPLGDQTLIQFLNSIVEILVTIGIPIIIIMVIYSGFLFVTAQGNPEKLAKAKKAIMWTFIGAMILLGAEILSGAISETITTIRNG